MRCDPTKEEKCATDEEFREWANGKSIILLENNFTFNKTDYSK